MVVAAVAVVVLARFYVTTRLSTLFSSHIPFYPLLTDEAVVSSRRNMFFESHEHRWTSGNWYLPSLHADLAFGESSLR